MVQRLTYRRRLSYDTAPTKPGCPKPLVIELFTFTPRRLGKHQNPHVVCAQADLEALVLWDLKFSSGCLKQRNTSAEPMVVPCVLNVSMTGSSVLSLLSRRSLWKYWKHKHRVRKLNKKWTISELKKKKERKIRWWSYGCSVVCYLLLFSCCF